MPREEFQKNQRVIFRRGGVTGGIQWFEGKITRVNGEGESYVIQEFEQCCEDMEIEGHTMINTPGSSYTIPFDQDNIRILPSEKSIMDRMYEAFHKPPTFEDPFAHLYMETSGEIKIPPQHEISGLINQSEFIEMVKVVSNRRKIVEGSFDNIAMSPLKTLHSILPKERDLWRLEQLAQTDPSAMLQLADIYRFGLLGLPKNRLRALSLYMLAAVGCGEKDLEINGPFKWMFGYPMGSPEALTAVAQEMWLNLCRMYDVQREEDYDELIRHLKFQHTCQVMDPMQMQLLEMIVPCLGHAIRRDWTSPFAMKFGKPVRVHQFLDAFFPDSMQIINALECIEVQKNEQTGVDFCKPSDFQLECFMVKATKIFLGLPIKIMMGPYGCPTDIHIEYREMAFPPYPIMVIVQNPHSHYVYETIKLPNELQYTPYSEEAFEYVWGSVVFNSMHARGGDGQRFRPKIITFADKPGDRLLAFYVKKQVGGDACGTIIKIINTRTYKLKFKGQMFTMQEAVEEIDMKFAAMMGNMMGGGFSEHRTPIEMAFSRFSNRSDMPVEELCSKLESLKQEGNEFFQRGRLQPAKRCYTDAINLIQSNAQLNDRAFVLLGTLLSNRAACFLKIAEGMSLDSSKTALVNGFDDCETALTNKSCMRVLPSSIKTKIEKRKNIAKTKISRLISQSSKLMRSEYVPEMGEEGEIAISDEQQTQSQLQPQRQQRHRKKKTKKGRKKQKQKQRRRQRQQRNRREGQEEHSDNDESDEDENDDREAISIATGKEMLESKITPFINGKEDTCPCCFDRFSVELEDIYCAVNPCGHAYCLRCISGLMKRSQKGSNPLGFNCPVCRIPIHKDILTDALDPIVSCTPSLKNRISSLPLKESEGMQVAKELCLRHDFKIPDILSALDVMLTDGLQASLRVSSDLSPSQKQEVYETARKSVDELWAEAKKLRSQMDLVYDLESENYQSMKKRLDELQNILIPAATKNAVNFIWQKMNSAGSMGIQDVNSGEIEIDFHALHVNEAIEVFNEQVLPILPAVVSVLLVVGRGNHSEGGNAKLKPALKKLIDNHSKMRHSRVEGNDGVIRVRWVR